MTTTTPRHTSGWRHRREREKWARLVAAGNAICARCGGWIAPESGWDLDHADDRESWIGVSHAHCNRAAGGRKSGRQRRALTEDRYWSREWL